MELLLHRLLPTLLFGGFIADYYKNKLFLAYKYRKRKAMWNFVLCAIASTFGGLVIHYLWTDVWNKLLLWPANAKFWIITYALVGLVVYIVRVLWERRDPSPDWTFDLLTARMGAWGPLIVYTFIMIWTAKL